MTRKLPEEILLEIFSHFTQEPDHLQSQAVLADHYTLARLCLVSQDFCRLAQPILFAFFDDSSLPRAGVGGKQAKFLRSLCLRPDLCSSVKSISVSPWTSLAEVQDKKVDQALREHLRLTPDPVRTALFVAKLQELVSPETWTGRDAESAKKTEKASQEVEVEHVDVNKRLDVSDDPDTESSMQRANHPESLRLLAPLRKSLASGVTEGIVALLLLLCPNIDHLRMKLPKKYWKSVVWDAINSGCGLQSATSWTAAGPHSLQGFDRVSDVAAGFDRNNTAQASYDELWPPGQPQVRSTFSDLRHLTLNCGAKWDHAEGRSSRTVRLRSIIHLLHLPSLVSFTGYGVIDMHTPDAHLEPIGKLAIKHLNLRKCFLGSDSIVELLNACSGLQKVELRWENGPVADRQDGVFATPIDLYRAMSWTEIRDALQAHRDSLVHLAVEDHRVVNSGVPWAPSFSIQFPSRSKGTCRPVQIWWNLPALSHLHISIRAVDMDRPRGSRLLVDLIPQSVRTLVLKAKTHERRWAQLEEDRRSQLKVLLVHESFASLSTIVLKGYRAPSDDDLKNAGWALTDRRGDVLLERKSSSRLDQRSAGCELGAER